MERKKDRRRGSKWTITQVQTIIKKQEQLSILIDKIEESVGNIFNDVSKLYINMTNPKDIQ